MKVQITYTEIQTLVNVIEVEMTKEEYWAYLDKSLKDQEQEYDFTANTSVEDGHHHTTQVLSIEAQILKK